MRIKRQRAWDFDNENTLTLRRMWQVKSDKGDVAREVWSE